VQDYEELKQLEDDLWAAADQLRANSRLTASEYAMPVLGLIFLRHATTRFNTLLPTVEEGIPARASGALREERVRLGFQGKAAIYLPETARYDHLAALPASTNVGEAIRDAMMAIEESVTDQNGNEAAGKGRAAQGYLGLEPTCWPNCSRSSTARCSRPPPAMCSAASTNTSSTSSP
jgi:type I restriction enzyme M protein